MSLDALRSPYILAILVYLVGLTLVGVYKARAVQDSADFMVAGRRLPWFILVGTLLATWIGNGSLFGGVGLGYRNGLAGLWSSCGAWLGIVLVYTIAGRVRNFGQVTVPDIFQSRYGSLSGLLATVTTAIAYLTIVSYQFRGGGKVLSIVTKGEITPENGVIITALFAVAYTVLAGMLSVVYTDVVNGVLMLIGILTALFYMVGEVGGFSEVNRIASELGNTGFFAHWDLESNSGGIGSGPVIAISFMVPTMMLLMGDANVYQRIFSAKNSGSARKAVFVWVFGVILLESSLSYLGLTGAAADSKGLLGATGDIPRLLADGSMNPAWRAFSEDVVPRVALSGLPTGLGMLLVATMMAVIVSTADSFLLVPATNLTRDVYQRFIGQNAGERRIVLVSRAVILVLGFVAFLLVEQFPTILAAAYTAYLIYGTSITPSLLAAFLSKRVTSTGAVASILTGAAVTITWTFFLPAGTFQGKPLLEEVTFPAATLSILALIVGSLLTRRPEEAVWKPFFVDRVEP